MLSAVSGTLPNMSESEYGPSPVPADADLWPGELPFTAWGQHGYGQLDLRVFDQDVYWVNIEQRPILIAADMSREYIANVVAHLEENCEYFYRQTVRRELMQRSGDLLLGRSSVSQVAERAGAPSLRDLTPAAWLDGTPLMRRLRRTLCAYDTAG